MSITRRQADDYDDLIKRSDEACDCHDCEACLRLGIQVFDWIIDTDRNYRRSLFAGSQPYSEEIEKALEFWIRRWHQNCEVVVQWAQHVQNLQFDVSHLGEFRLRCEEAAAIVESLDDAEQGRIMSEPLIILRDRALEDHANGQTAEFF